jgi:hypothetical protein
VDVEPRAGFCIWLRYEDGVEGEFDLPDVAGTGVFAAWLDRDFLENVRVGELGEIAWRNEIDLCPEALYLEITGRSPEEICPGLGGRSRRA